MNSLNERRNGLHLLLIQGELRAAPWGEEEIRLRGGSPPSRRIPNQWALSWKLDFPSMLLHSVSKYLIINLNSQKGAWIHGQSRGGAGCIKGCDWVIWCQCDVQRVFMLLTGQYNYNDKGKKYVDTSAHMCTIQILSMPDYQSRPELTMNYNLKY